MSVGIKETSEALVAVNEVALEIASKFKDGVQFTDFTEFYADLITSGPFKAAMEAAWEGHQAIPEEVKDIDLGEGVSLVVLQASYVPKLIQAFLG